MCSRKRIRITRHRYTKNNMVWVCTSVKLILWLGLFHTHTHARTHARPKALCFGLSGKLYESSEESTMKFGSATAFSEIMGICSKSESCIATSLCNGQTREQLVTRENCVHLDSRFCRMQPSVRCLWAVTDIVHFNPLTPELNPSAQLCLPRFFTGDYNF
jgi:hypothetical protein